MSGAVPRDSITVSVMVHWSFYLNDDVAPVLPGELLRRRPNNSYVRFEYGETDRHLAAHNAATAALFITMTAV